ncbi:type VII toxin-antitoxin system MntA family adenylyltransferase antitoxin [Cellvibrio sp. QJXJ]|uniref:type VII toxin-antitoxin system MntA family adenylyltransferase antitoxin n=1 Tax=Cellvibrio sp. QJXJ TaxID=2964606 RepID=UPI0021C28705|nr:nucleotidyltransferase domain-containing protein [Cellvibrio sp. QJXJ]UUA72398.1 nucleotidyltransferase domain-containing protein [Cellvibrio sp. QJXJ]
MEQKKIIAALEKHPEINIAYIFGSVAKGTARPDSDLDIAVQDSKPLTTEQYIALVEDLAIASGRAIDLIDLKTTGVPLLGEILQGQRLLGSDADHAELIKRHLFESADFLPYVERMLTERRAQWTK